jgi:hypothetical protein
MISWFRAQYDELNPFGRFFFGLGFVSLCVAAGMTFKFGWSMSVLHALGLGVLSIVASFLPEAAYRLGEDGKGYLAGVIALAAVPLLGVEYFSHVGYTVGQRVENTQQTGVHNTKFEDARKSLASDEANLTLWKEHLDRLKGENPWVTSVSADGLKAQVAAADEAIKQEERRGGCGPKCLGLMKEKAGLEERIALASEAGKLAKQIEATQRIIDGKTEVASKATFESSPVVNQTAFVAKLVGMSLEPDAATQEGSQIGISASLALANVLLTPICFLIAGRNRKGFEAKPATPAPAVAVVEAMPAETRIIRQTVRDERALRILADVKRQLLERPAAAAA